MRAQEFLRENNHEQLLTLLTTLHASRVPAISLTQVQQSLENAGFFVTNKWISDQLANIQKHTGSIIKSFNDDEISLDVEIDTSDKDKAVDSEEAKDTITVKKMAKKALKKRKKD